MIPEPRPGPVESFDEMLADTVRRVRAREATAARHMDAAGSDDGGMAVIGWAATRTAANAVYARAAELAALNRETTAILAVVTAALITSGALGLWFGAWLS